MTQQGDPTPPPPPPAPVPPPVPPPAPSPAPPPPAPAPAQEPPEETDPVKLRTALAAERRQREAAENSAKAHKGELDRIKQASMTEQERAVQAARDEATKTATTGFNKKMMTAEVKMAVAGRVVDATLFDDPDISLRLLGMNDIPLTASGDLDSGAIKKAVEDLLKTKPWLVAAPGATPPAPRFGAGDQGPRGAGGEPDISTMTMDEYLKYKNENDPRLARRRLRTGAPHGQAS